MWWSRTRCTVVLIALTLVLGSIAGTALLGVVLPAVLMGALDPFPIWLLYAVLTVVAATALGWRWQALASGGGEQASSVCNLMPPAHHHRNGRRRSHLTGESHCTARSRPATV
jgi:hypothetical protein